MRVQQAAWHHHTSAEIFGQVNLEGNDIVDITENVLGDEALELLLLAEEWRAMCDGLAVFLDRPRF